MAELIGMSAEVKGQNIQLGDADLTVGRAADNRLSIQTASVSGHHCRIYRDGEQYFLEDLGSTNGTRIKGKPVTEPTALRPKDLVQIGSIEFLFNVEGMDAPEPEGDASFAAAEVVEAQEPAETPGSFGSFSPFGARHHQSAGLWSILLVLLGLVALAAVALVAYTLFVD